MENYRDNMMVIVAMFDHGNQAILSKKLSGPSKVAIHERILDGGGWDFIFI